MRRWPIGPTIVVAVAVVIMVGLGCWQLLVRLPEKEAYLAQLAQNPSRPAIPFPRTPDDTLLFRRAETTCLPPITIAKAGAGSAGYRLIASCAHGVVVQLGTARNPNLGIVWAGGPVSGWLAHRPDATPLIAQAFRHGPQPLLLIADRPVAGLAANLRPDIASVPNSHLAYAGQWFFFAAIAAIIYVLAVRRRQTLAVQPMRPEAE